MHTVRPGFLPVAAQKKKRKKISCSFTVTMLAGTSLAEKHLLHPNVAVVSQRKHQDGVKSIASCRDDASYAKDLETFHGRTPSRRWTIACRTREYVGRMIDAYVRNAVL